MRATVYYAVVSEDGAAAVYVAGSDDDLDAQLAELIVERLGTDTDEDLAGFEARARQLIVAGRPTDGVRHYFDNADGVGIERYEEEITVETQ